MYAGICLAPKSSEKLGAMAAASLYGSGTRNFQQSIFNVSRCCSHNTQIRCHNKKRLSLTITMTCDRDNAQAMELQRIYESRPKPLSVSDLPNSVSHGSRLRVAYQGVPGAYSESAAAKAYHNCEAVPCEQFDTAFDAVERWLVDRAVLPIENSLGGSIHRNYDLLLRHSLHIVGEVRLSIRHCLLANHDVQLEDLKRVLSHPQALAQCENTLTKLGVVREAVDDTAGAAQTSIVFSLEEGPGVLFKALAVFAMRRINLTKIESRPRRKQPMRTPDDSSNGTLKYFDYLFYVDFEASMADPNSQNALKHLEEFATFLRVLGSYPADNISLSLGT